MSNGFLHAVATVGWNGIRIQVPSQWETVVTGSHHLIFEEDFNPVFQIRWKKIGPLNPAKWRDKSDQWWKQLGVTSQAIPLPAELVIFNDNFTQTRYYRGKQPMASGGLCYCSQCESLFFFQQLDAQNSMWKKTAEVLSTLSCHNPLNNLWQIQDFVLKTPTTYILNDYTFKAGLTRLSFEGKTYNMQICRLAQASHRLSLQSLTELLFTLIGTRQITVELSADQHECSASRSPSVAKQILFRMRKEKPFIEAKIRHVPDQDRILACVAFSTRPISSNEVYFCYETLKIV